MCTCIYEVKHKDCSFIMVGETLHLLFRVAKNLNVLNLNKDELINRKGDVIESTGRNVSLFMLLSQVKRTERF